jgi:hypothetical protein
LLAYYLNFGADGIGAAAATSTSTSVLLYCVPPMSLLVFVSYVSGIMQIAP